MAFFDGLVSGAFDLVGGALGARSAESAGNKNRDFQREMAQHGMQWRVADAKAAGLHPLAALGAQLPSGGSPYISAGDYGITQAGQDISRAFAASRTADQRAQDDVAARIADAQLKNWELRNRQLEIEINKSQVPPPNPSITAGQSKIEPAEITSWNPDAPHMTAGPPSPSGTEYDLGPTLGGVWNLPAGKLNEALEDMGLAKYAWLLANNVPQIRSMDQRLGDYLEPYTGTREKTEEIMRAAEELRAWAQGRKRALYNARNREYNRTRGWGREAR